MNDNEFEEFLQIGTQGDVIENLIEHLRQRQAIGLETYGQPLKPEDATWQMFSEELLDSWIYLWGAVNQHPQEFARAYILARKQERLKPFLYGMAIASLIWLLIILVIMR
jgi:hypothetical protein